MGFDFGAFAGGVAEGYQKAEVLNNQRLKAEAANKVAAAKLGQQTDKQIKAIRAKQTSLAKASGAYKSDVALIQADNNLDDAIKVKRINALKDKHQPFITGLTNEISTMIGTLPVDMQDSFGQETSSLSQMNPNYTQVTVGNKTVNVTEQDAQVIKSQQPEAVKIGENGNVQISGSNGDPVAEVQPVAINVSALGTENQKLFTDNKEDYFDLEAQLFKAKLLNQTEKVSELTAKKNKAYANIQRATKSVGGWKPPKISKEENKEKNLLLKDIVNPNSETAKVSESIVQLIDKNLIDFNQPGELKSVSSSMLKMGKDEILDMYEKVYDKKGQNYAESFFLPLLKAEAANKGTHATEALYGDKALDMVGTIIEKDSKVLGDIGVYGYLKREAEKLKSGTGNKAIIDHIYKNDVEPLIKAYEGKSGEYYKDAWDAAGKQYKRDSIHPLSDMPFFKGFGSAREAVASFQDYVDDYGNGFQNLARDLLSTDEENVDRFMNNTFPKIQLAHKLKYPDQALLTPMDFMTMLGEDYESNNWSDYGSAKEDTKLYNLITIANKIQF